ncbi:MAG: amino acid ABC transporter ATP-binding protein [Starkeya sp.]|nr:amino acid ABC transporter ATP-binding protein [Starkeya sp.]
MSPRALPADLAAVPAIHLAGVVKRYGTHRALAGVDLDVRRGERVVVCGPSGSGKSTLIRCINALERHDGGRIVVNGVELTGDEGTVQDIRQEVGMVFQHFNLFPHLTALENCMLAPRLNRGLSKAQAEKLAMAHLERVHLADQARKYPARLSGGQQQRVAIARALVQGAKLVLADEPIASLDPKSAKRVMDTLVTMSRDHGIALVVSLHQVDYATAYFDRVVAMNAGKVVFDGPASQINAAFLTELYGASAEELILPSQFVVPAPADAAPLTQTVS